MRTRSQSREQHPPPPEEPPVVIEPLRIEYPFQEDPPVEPMADTRTMAQLLQAPTEGACPHHGSQIASNLIPFLMFEINDQDSLNLRSVKKNQASAPAPASAPVKAVELVVLLCGGAPFLIRTCPATLTTFIGETSSEYVSQAAAANYNQGITTRSGVAYQGPPIPTSSVVKPIPEVTKDQVHPSCSQSTAPVQPPVGPEPITTPVFEPIVAPVVAPVPNTKPSVSLPYPSRRDNEKSRNQANEQIDKFYEIFKKMSFEISFTDALVLMPKFASTLRTLLGNKEKLTEVARTSNEPCLARTSMNEHCSAVILNKLPRKLGDPGKFLIPFWEKLSLPDLTPTCMTLELADRSISKPMGIAKDISVKIGVFHFPADFVVVDFEPDPRVPLILGRCFLKKSCFD
ncbi:reverse transcriptase domain-containing protein [Tanacetum coccineum]